MKYKATGNNNWNDVPAHFISETHFDTARLYNKTYQQVIVDKSL